MMPSAQATISIARQSSTKHQGIARRQKSRIAAAFPDPQSLSYYNSRTKGRRKHAPIARLGGGDEDLIDLDNGDGSSTTTAVIPWLVWYRDIGFKAHNPDPTLRRSVLIQGIQSGSRVVDLYDQLNCGTIISLRYCRSAGMRTKPCIDTDTAIADFVDARHAEDFARSHPGSKVLSLPSRPLDLTLVEKIRAGTVSRKLMLDCRPDTALEAESIRSEPHERGWLLEFASILAASQAHAKLFFGGSVRAEYV